MKPFNLERALAGDLVQYLVHGSKYNIGKLVYVSPHNEPGKYLIVNEGKSESFSYSFSYWAKEEELFMAPSKRTVWINLYNYLSENSIFTGNTTYATKELCEKFRTYDTDGSYEHLGTYSIEIEE